MIVTQDPGFTPSAAERHAMIAVAAYYLAEQRGFAPGQADHDWTRAEQQIDRMLEHLRHHHEQPAEVLQQLGLRHALRLWGDH
jgi:hypothetical protein